MIASKLENNVKIRLLEVIGIMSFSIGIIRDDFFFTEMHISLSGNLFA